MLHHLKLRYFFIFLVVPAFSVSQTITYTEPERDESRSIEFEIIGKVSGNYLVYKNIRNRKYISVYDNKMDLIDKAELDFMPEKVINTDFIAYPDHSYLIYQHQKKSVVYCMAAKLSDAGKLIGEPLILDTTHISFFSDNKIYNVEHSEDKQKIMVYKIQKKYDKFLFTTVLFDAALQLQKKSRTELPYDENKNIYTEFMLDNDGTFVFAKNIKAGSREMISSLAIIIKPAASDNFEVHELDFRNFYLDEVKLKADNINKKYIVNSFFYKQRRGNIEGLYTAIWDKESNKLLASNTIEFSDSIKMQAKNSGASKYAFNNYFIRNIILKRDGGFILSAEDFTSQSRSNTWNRYDYLYRYPYMSAYDYYLYSPSYYWYYRQRALNSIPTRYYYNNIVVFNVDKAGKLKWSNVIHKEQYDDETDNYLSYQVLNAGGELHFLFNELEKRNQLISDQSITPDGKLIRNPTLKSLDKGYEFMPKYAKQVSAKQIIVPCTYRNYICFAKIDY